MIDLLCEHGELAISEIGKFLNVGKSTAFRLLTTLQSKNYVYKDKNSKYRLSPKIFINWGYSIG
ncbi:MAG: MarR family transcriptional regulator [Intestinibacter bartlettii]